MDCGMKHHCSGNGHYRSDVSLRNTVVVVCSHSSEVHDLLEFRQTFRELGRREDFGVVRQEFLRDHSIAATSLFKLLLCFERFMRC